MPNDVHHPTSIRKLKKKTPIDNTIWINVSFASKFSPNFNLKNMILTYTKDF